MWNGEGLLTGKGSILGAVPDWDSSCAGSVEGTAMIDSTNSYFFLVSWALA